MSVMRSSILPGLLSTLQYNENRQRERLRLFETGLVFIREGDEIRQTAMLAGLITGSRLPENWSNNKEISDFYDLKGDIETLLGLGGNLQQFSFASASAAGFHSGQCARVDLNGAVVGHLGALHPALQRQLGINSATYVFEFCLEKVQQALLASSKALSKYPEVNRDLAIVIDETVSAQAILALIQENAGKFLTSHRIFDVYQGDAVQKGKKSVALGLTWQHPSRTLSDDEVNATISSCVNALQDKFNANLRN
jgi:phenylalanyl-tRNA synthetase beta chain